MTIAATSKLNSVRTWFDAPNKYLDPRQFDIRIRKDVVREFLGIENFKRAIDIGCGDGSISLTAMDRIAKLTLLDISANMLAVAGRNVPENASERVELTNGGFPDLSLQSGEFDLVFCIGVLAHVDSPGHVIAEIARIAQSGAKVILEFTDSFHPWSVPIIVYQNLLKLRRPAPYSLNRLGRRSILRLCRAQGLEPCRLYRYSHPPIGTGCFVGQDSLFAMTRRVFGSPVKNRNRWMGNQFIYLLQKQ
jgi:ubiquinone/menaquinone biosynthesis C-methylase UbiE